MANKAFSTFLILIAASAMSACNYTKLKEVAPDASAFGNLDPQEKATTMNYAYINENILKPKCVSCHGSSGGVNLESYDNVLKQQRKIHQSVFVDMTMPKKGALDDEQKRLLWHWLQMGCPKESSSGGGPTNPPDELEATYDSINKNIFQPKCVSCHQPGEDGQRISLDKEALLNSPLELIIPGNPDESGLVIAVERTDEKRMPLAKEGYGPLSDKEKAAIRKWIEDGAN